MLEPIRSAYQYIRRLGLPPVSVLRPVTRYARGAWGCVRCSTGRFGQRDSSPAGARRSVWRATRRAAFCRHTGFVDCGWVFFRRQTCVSRPVCTAFGPALWPAHEQALPTVVRAETAPRRVAVELKASQHDSASISRCSKQTAVHKSSGGLLAEHKLQQHQQGSAARCHAKREREA